MIGELQGYRGAIDHYRETESQIEEAQVMLELVEEENSFEYLDEIKTRIDRIGKQMEKLKLKVLLNGEYDKNAVILSIHAGAGGLEAQDWAEQLYRMYTRWASDQGFEVEVIDYNADTEGGLKSVTFSVDGL